MITEFTVRTTYQNGKQDFTTYRSKMAALECFNRCNAFHEKKKDGVLVELFKVIRYGSSINRLEKII